MPLTDDVLLNESLPKTGEESYFKPVSLRDKKYMIRLIKFLPSDDPSQCDILHVSLSDDHTPNYEALSYTWEAKARSVLFTADNSAFL